VTISVAKVPNAVEILRKKMNRLSRADRQTTDGRAIAYSERERSLKIDRMPEK